MERSSSGGTGRSRRTSHLEAGSVDVAAVVAWEYGIYSVNAYLQCLCGRTSVSMIRNGSAFQDPGTTFQAHTSSRDRRDHPNPERHAISQLRAMYIDTHNGVK